MKHVTRLALAAVAAGALMAFLGAGTASATVLCSTTVEVCPTAQKWGNVAFDFSIPLGSSANLRSTESELISQCSISTVKGKITNSGSSTETVSGSVEEWTFSSCTFPTKTLKTGSLEVHKIAGTSNGTVTAGGTFEWTNNTTFFGSCVYKIEKGQDLGTLVEGKPATFVVNTVSTKAVGGGACPETLLWSANYTLTEPKETTLSVSSSTD